MNKIFENTSMSLFELDDALFEIKNNFPQNVENILTNIDTNINNLTKKENQIEINFQNICTET